MIKHISNNIRKAKSALECIRYAARQNIKLSSLVQLVRATVLSRLQYRLHLCSPISVTQFKHGPSPAPSPLVSGATSKTSDEAILNYMGFMKLQQTYQLQTAEEYVRALTTESHPLYDELQRHDEISVRLKRVIPWTKAARDILVDALPVESIMPDPWVVLNDKPLLIDAIGDRTWRERDLASIMLKWQNTLSQGTRRNARPVTR